MINIMKATGRVLTLCILSLIYLPLTLFADMIYLKDGRKISAGKYEIINNRLIIKEKKNGSQTEIPLENVVKITAKDRSTLNFYQKGTAAKTTLPDNEKNDELTLIWNKETEGLITPFPFSLNYTYSSGETTVNIYNENQDKVANGEALYTENRFSISTVGFGTSFFISPELGFFQRTIDVRDFSEKSHVSDDNIIPGIITDPLTGEEIPRERVYSLEYEAEFNTFFLDLKAGFRFAAAKSWLIWSIDMSVFGNLAEYRETKFRFNLSETTEEFSEPFSFSYLGSYGLGIGTGLYFTKIRTGISLSYDYRVLRKYNLPEEIRFKQSYYDNEYNTTRTREIKAEYSDITAKIIVLRVYFIL